MSRYSRLNKAIRERRELRERGLLPPYMLGKEPARIDKQNIRLSSILRALPPLPDEYSIDAHLPVQVPTPMFANNEWGCCVVAAFGHQVLRFEGWERKKALSITDNQILRAYWDWQPSWCRCFNPTPNKGLVLLDALKFWRNDGWEAGDMRHNIDAFAQINELSQYEIKASIYLLMGAQVGVQLPISAKDQFASGDMWTVVPGPSGARGSWGGHGIDVLEWGPSFVESIHGCRVDGVVCATWGMKQAMTWDFLRTYADEAYGVVDDRDKFLPDSPVDVDLLNRYLREIEES